MGDAAERGRRVGRETSDERSRLGSRDSEDDAVPARETAWAATWWLHLRPLLLAAAFPAVMLAIWHFSTVGRPGSLVPPPYEVWLELRDLAFGGINYDAYSGTLHVHLLASISRVYGGFALALIVALPLGMMIGRVPLVRQLLDPTIQILRPVLVTAWLPLAKPASNSPITVAFSAISGA